LRSRSSSEPVLHIRKLGRTRRILDASIAFGAGSSARATGSGSSAAAYGDDSLLWPAMWSRVKIWPPFTATAVMRSLAAMRSGEPLGRMVAADLGRRSSARRWQSVVRGDRYAGETAFQPF
jgi:hypothetical protein